ncbi:MAG TPA: HAD family hydrolase [Anaerolineales bacterium]|nr:HAD family hydrolase [Anaerolineales bacterium]
MNSNHSIKAIFFDLDGTLRHNVPSADQILNAYLIEHGINIDPDDHLKAMRWEYSYWANSPDLRDDIIAHSMDTDQFWTEYTKRRLLALNLSLETSTEFAPKVSRHMGESYKPESIVPDDVRRVLPQLKKAGYVMAVISNRDKPFQETLDSHGLSEFFDFSLAGGDVDIYKPDPGIFEHALQRANLTAQETVYVGDNYFADVIGSRRAGLQPVLYDPDGIFADVDCTIIKSFDELLSVVKDM